MINMVYAEIGPVEIESKVLLLMTRWISCIVGYAFCSEFLFEILCNNSFGNSTRQGLVVYSHILIMLVGV